MVIFLCVNSLAFETVDGCQGEGCGCFQGYRKAIHDKQPTKFELESIRPFTLYLEMSKKSKVIGNFKSGVKAKPGKFKILFVGG